MSLNRSRSPPHGKRFRSIERVSYRDAPHSRDRRNHRLGIILRQDAISAWWVKDLVKDLFVLMVKGTRNKNPKLDNCLNLAEHFGVVAVMHKNSSIGKDRGAGFSPFLVRLYSHLWCKSQASKGQDYLCNKCKRPGHFARECPNMTVCNNCRLPGHVAAECNSTTMCWNCKEPGHLANQCPNEPVCHMCGNMGHLARDCINLGLPAHDARLCNNCYKQGHIAADCTNEKACNNCRKTGHLARDCLYEPVCNICNISGHVARHCTKSSLSSDMGSPFQNIICRNCGQPGHISRDCVSIVISNNCHGRGHLHYECPSARMYDCLGVRRY
ncbi:hypothetical protein POUND7_007911 [Theobroma cacao]